MAVQLFGNINGKSYCRPTINLFEQAKKQNAQPKMLKDMKTGDNMPEVKVNISQDGLKALQDTMKALHGTRLEGSMNYDEIQKNKEFICNHHPIGSFSSIFANAMPSNYEQNENGEYVYVKRSIEEKTERIVNKYHSLYNEIVSGYNKGTRIRFIEDETAEDGYRQISKEEELSILENEFQDFVEKRLKPDSDFSISILEEYVMGKDE